jgi:uncharacterized protein (TIGR03437 family)
MAVNPSITFLVAAAVGFGRRAVKAGIINPLLFLLTMGSFLQAQSNITTVAGSPFVFPLSVNGGPAVAAPLRDIGGVAVDSAGNVYASDFADHIVVKISPLGVLTIVAGNGTRGFSGDGGPAASGIMNGPTGLTVDPGGNLYIADSGNGRVRRVSPNGIIATVVGTGLSKSSSQTNYGDGGPATQAYLSEPSGLATDAHGNLYIADSSNFEVRVVDSGGIIHTLAGVPSLFPTLSGNSGPAIGDGGPAINAPLVFPQGVAVDLNTGNVFIADSWNQRIRMVTPAGIISTVAGTGTAGFSGDGGPATAAQLSFPSGLSVDSVGVVYIATEGAMRKFTPGGNMAPVGNGEAGADVVPDKAGNLFFAQGDFVREISAGGAVVTVAGSGSSSFYGDGGPAISAQLYAPEGVAVDGGGNLYIADGTNHVRKVAPNGIIVTVAGVGQAGFAGDGGPAISAQLSSPQGLASDAAGNLYVADGGNNRVRKITPLGIISTVAGNGQAGYSGDGGVATSAQLNNPIGVAVDAAGTLYIADTWNYRIRAVSPTGTIRTVAGTGVLGFSGDGGPATGAELAGPSGIAVDSGGNLYIVDSSILSLMEYSNQRIRKVDAKGMISTIAGTGAPGYSGGGGPATSAEIYFPEAITVDLAGNLYFLDAGNSALRKITTGGVISTIATGNMGDDGVPQAGGGVAVDAAGDVFFSQYLASTVTKVTPSLVPYLSTPAYNAASLRPAGSTGLAPGSLISLFGYNLASAAASSGSGSLPTTLLDTNVTIGGVTAPLVYVSPNQINLQIPFGTATGQATIEILRSSAGMVSSPMVIGSVSPGIFRVRAPNLGAIVTLTGEVAADPLYLPGVPARPANPGEYVSIYCTGLGDVTNRPANGAAAPGGPTYSETVLKPTVTIGGMQAIVTYSGLAPGYVGLYQVNVQVPANATPGNLIPVTLMIGGAADTVDMAIQ